MFIEQLTAVLNIKSTLKEILLSIKGQALIYISYTKYIRTQAKQCKKLFLLLLDSSVIYLKIFSINLGLIYIIWFIIFNKTNNIVHIFKLLSIIQALYLNLALILFELVIVDNLRIKTRNQKNK